MEKAGRAVAEEVRRTLGAIDKRQILLLIGPGNNGDDGLVAARYLSDWGARVSLYLFSQRAPDDQNFKLVQERGLNCLDATKSLDGLEETLASASAVVDALFGTGKSRPIEGFLREALDEVSQAKKGRPNLHIFALDLPSGLNADTGKADPACLYADDTITLGFPKPGLFSASGVERTGRIKVVDIGIPAHLAGPVSNELMTDEGAKSVLPKRPLEANKGSFGRILVVAGSLHYIGAAYLACNGAMRVGAGLVTLATATSLQPILASKLTEVTYLPLPESSPGIVSPEAVSVIQPELERYQVLLFGCGLGQSQSAINFTKSLFLGKKTALPALILDADALNILAGIDGWWQKLAADAIVTPHPGEMARLAKSSIDEVQADRSGVATRKAAEWHKTVVLKGACTVVAAPEGRSRISPFANPGLASAGTGDVLAGAIAGLVAQGLSLFDGASLGVYLHGRAGDIVKAVMGDTGMTAGDLLPVLPLAIKRLKGSAQPL
jgi:NAD(P)H-hydrate epimerase